MCGKLLAWRNQKSSELKTQRRASKNTDQKPSKTNVICLTRSWHFFDPVLDSLQADANLSVSKVDLKPLDEALISKGLASKNKSANNRKDALALMKKTCHYKPTNGPFYQLDHSIFSANEFENADIYFVDWLNQNTVSAQLHIPLDKRVIVRVHSYEIFSYFAPIIDYGRIDELVFISKGIRDIFLELWSWLLPDGISIRVIDNLRTTDRFAKDNAIPLDNDQRRFHLGMVQYTDTVKDLAFALRSFKKLLEQDDRFTLHLAGTPFLENGSNIPIEVKQLLADIDRKHVCEHGYIKNMSWFYKKVGIMLSTSIREGSHESIVEGLYHGCVPCLRDWPLLQPFNGAHLAFPDYTAIQTESDMAADILAKSANFDQASQNAMENSHRYFDKFIGQQYQQLMKAL